MAIFILRKPHGSNFTESTFSKTFFNFGIISEYVYSIDLNILFVVQIDSMFTK